VPGGDEQAYSATVNANGKSAHTPSPENCAGAGGTQNRLAANGLGIGFKATTSNGCMSSSNGSPPSYGTCATIVSVSGALAAETSMGWNSRSNSDSGNSHPVWRSAFQMDFRNV